MLLTRITHWLASCKQHFCKRLRRNLVLTLCLAAVLCGYGWGHYQLNRFDHLAIAGEARLFTVKKGMSARGLVGELAGQPVSPFWTLVWLKLHPELAQIKVGTYRLESGWLVSHALLLFSSGKEVLFSVTLIEGGRIEDFIRTLKQAPYIESTLDEDDADEVRSALSLEPDNIEGLLLPETYAYTAGTRDLDILRRSREHMSAFLDKSWANRAQGLPYKSAYEALIMASIIEKETGKAAERPLIASVFINRLRKGMRLQTDPTVIYGIKDRYDGNIRKVDLLDENPYNTYLIDGLPPTPIAMPSKAAILAALHPASSNYLYFVAKGGGEHHFSRTLAEHNNAVRRYILGRP
jgi:UPF0755 protein